MRRRVLNTMKRLEIVLERQQLGTVERLLDSHSTGYTVLPEVTGYGHHGHRHGDIVVLVTVITRDHVDPLLDVLVPMLDQRSGVVLISDVSVLRGEYFTPECKAKAATLPSY